MSSLQFSGTWARSEEVHAPAGVAAALLDSQENRNNGGEL